MSTATPAFFWFLFAWRIFFHPLIFSLYVSLCLTWVSCRQHVHGSCFCICSTSLCLSVGAFNPSPFKVIVDMYAPVTIFLIVLGLFCGPFSSPVYPVCRNSFNICCKADLVLLNALRFCLSLKFLISPLNSNEILTGKSHLGCRFFPFRTLNISCHSFLACRISVEKSADSFMEFPSMLPSAFPLPLLIFNFI